MKLESLSVSELNNLKIDIDKEISLRKDSERDNVRKELEQLAKERGYVLDDLLGKRAKTATGHTRKPAKIKYQHPGNKELTWTGRGRQPAWVKDWVTGGHAIEKLAVK